MDFEVLDLCDDDLYDAFPFTSNFLGAQIFKLSSSKSQKIKKNKTKKSHLK